MKKLALTKETLAVLNGTKADLVNGGLVSGPVTLCYCPNTLQKNCPPRPK